MEQKSVFYPIFLRQYLQRTLCKGTKISDTRCSYDVLISNLDGRLSGCSPYPIHPKFITSFDRDTPRLISDRGLFRNKSRIFENGVGSSGCPVASPRKRPTSFRVSMWFDRLHQGSTGCIGVHRWGLWSFGGWVYGGLGLHLGVVGDGGNGVHYSYHKQCPQFSEGVYGPTGPAPNST